MPPITADETNKHKQAPFNNPTRKTSQPRSMYSSGSHPDIANSSQQRNKRKSMQYSTPSIKNNADATAAQQYLNQMALSGATSSATRKSNRSVANTSNRSGFRGGGNARLDPLPPRAGRANAGSVSGRKGGLNQNKMVDVVLFPQSIGSGKNAARQDRPDNNMITIGSNASNSAFK